MDINGLVERSISGDHDAFAVVLRHFQRPLFGFLGRMGFSQAQAEDLAQETFLRAWQKLGDYDPQRAAFSTWLFTLARNRALNELNRPAVRHEILMGDDLPDHPSTQPVPLNQWLIHEQNQLLQAALRQLPLADRSVLALAYIEDLDLSAIGRIEGVSTGAIKTRLHRARQKLRELLGVEFLENNDE
ncbi:RNA polymerase sigma factor [Halothiobacillus sp.]|uniref:RNA polymerase sigma factor n=1 Tax=Halothiobacillus sp. TaxID=1891311 RepID=UPI002AD30B60|nr:sigma-70 family RNA polymerase sigma factor [Halothiobacillus sp.]